MRALAVLLLAAACVQAQDWARQMLDKSPRHHEYAAIEHDGRKVQTFIAYPETDRKTLAVILIHENQGLTDWVKLAADEVAAAGYIALAPDLLSGAGPSGGGTSAFPAGQATPAIYKLPPDQVTADLNAVADYAKKIPSATGKIAVAGFCWGGTQSFRFATNRPDLSAAFVFYGTPPDKDAIARIHAPVYGFYGGNDERVDATIPNTETLMKEAGKTYVPVVYPGAGHGFMRAGEAPDANQANRSARNEAWSRWRALLHDVERPASQATIRSVHATRAVALSADPESAFWRGIAPVKADRGPQGAPADGSMQVRSRWTDQDVYFLFQSPYETLYLKPSPDIKNETNKLWDWDVAEVFIGGDPEHPRHYREFEVSPQGEWVDLDIDRDHPLPEGGVLWNSGFETKARIDQGRKIWYGAMRIPWKSIMERKPAAGETLRVNFYRIEGPEPHRKYIAWQPTFSRSYHVPEAFGMLLLVR